MKNIILGIIAVLILAGGAYFLLTNDTDDTTTVGTDTNTETSAEDEGEDTELPEEDNTQTVLGTSVGGNDIMAYHYGTGDTELIFVGGIHGGYSWNTALVAYELMDYLEADLSNIAENLKVTVIPALNPDGLQAVTGKVGEFTSADVDATQAEQVTARFNGNNVDLNRNFDCAWRAEGVWQSRSVSGGSAPFSEPETQAVRDYITANTPVAVVVYYSSAGGVFASSCNNGVSDETRELTNLYADASGYPAFEEFDFYEITGDMVNWLAKNDIPGISVLLSDHQNIEWSKNRAGIESLLNYYAN